MAGEGAEIKKDTKFAVYYIGWNPKESEKFTVTLNNAQLGFNSSYVKHLLKTQLYADAAGVMKVAFGVDLADSNALVWRNTPGGLYADKHWPGT